MKKTITVLLGMLSLATFLHAQNISSYRIITTGSVLKSEMNGNIVLTQPIYEKLVVDQSALKSKEAVKLQSAVKVYPNPFSETVTVEITIDDLQFTNLEFMLFDLLGREVRKVDNRQLTVGKNSFHIDLKGLKTGMYFLKTVTDNGDTESIIKLIKQ